MKKYVNVLLISLAFILISCGSGANSNDGKFEKYKSMLNSVQTEYDLLKEFDLEEKANNTLNKKYKINDREEKDYSLTITVTDKNKNKLRDIPLSLTYTFVDESLIYYNTMVHFDNGELFYIERNNQFARVQYSDSGYEVISDHYYSLSEGYYNIYLLSYSIYIDNCELSAIDVDDEFFSNYEEHHVEDEPDYNGYTAILQCEEALETFTSGYKDVVDYVKKNADSFDDIVYQGNTIHLSLVNDNVGKIEYQTNTHREYLYNGLHAFSEVNKYVITFSEDELHVDILKEQISFDNEYFYVEDIPNNYFDDHFNLKYKNNKIDALTCDINSGYNNHYEIYRDNEKVNYLFSANNELFYVASFKNGMAINYVIQYSPEPLFNGMEYDSGISLMNNDKYIIWDIQITCDKALAIDFFPITGYSSLGCKIIDGIDSFYIEKDNEQELNAPEYVYSSYYAFVNEYVGSPLLYLKTKLGDKFFVNGSASPIFLNSLFLDTGMPGRTSLTSIINNNQKINKYWEDILSIYNLSIRNDISTEFLNLIKNYSYDDLLNPNTANKYIDLNHFLDYLNSNPYYEPTTIDKAFYQKYGDGVVKKDGYTAIIGIGQEIIEEYDVFGQYEDDYEYVEVIFENGVGYLKLKTGMDKFYLVFGIKGEPNYYLDNYKYVIKEDYACLFQGFEFIDGKADAHKFINLDPMLQDEYLIRISFFKDGFNQYTYPIYEKGILYVMPEEGLETFTVQFINDSYSIVFYETEEYTFEAGKSDELNVDVLYTLSDGRVNFKGMDQETWDKYTILAWETRDEYGHQGKYSKTYFENGVLSIDNYVSKSYTFLVAVDKSVTFESLDSIYTWVKPVTISKIYDIGDSYVEHDISEFVDYINNPPATTRQEITGISAEVAKEYTIIVYLYRLYTDEESLNKPFIVVPTYENGKLYIDYELGLLGFVIGVSNSLQTDEEGNILWNAFYTTERYDFNIRQSINIVIDKSTIQR